MVEGITLNRSVLSLVLVAVLVCVPLSIASAGTTYTWNYPFFNTETPDYRALDEATTSLSIAITHNLEFNGTTEVAKAVLGICNGSSGTVYRLDIAFIKDLSLEVIVNMPDYVKIVSDTWVANQTTYVKLESDGDLFIYSDDKTYIDDYNIGTFTVSS